MKFGRTIVFTLLFFIAAVIYIYQTRLTKQFLTNVPDEVNRSVAISLTDTIDRVELIDHVQKTQVTLGRTNGAWSLEVPVRYPAESRIVQGFLAAGRMATRQPRLRAEKEWDEYGLAKPEIEIRFYLPEEKTATLLLGTPAPVGKAVYARWKDERGYFLLPSEMRSVFRQSVYGLREKRLFRVPPESFRKIFLEMGERSYEWKKDGNHWVWFEPVSKFAQKVSPGQMDAVMDLLQSLHVKEFQDNNKKSRSELGFFVIHDRIRIESEGGKIESFCFGNEVPEKNAYYGYLEGENTVFLVDREKVIQLFDLMRKIQNEDPKLK